MIKKINRSKARILKHLKIRKNVRGTELKPRLCIYKSNYSLYAQVINDETSTTIIGIKENGKTMKNAEELGAKIGAKLLEKNIQEVCFDRSGYVYNGKIKVFADAVRKTGIKF